MNNNNSHNNLLQIVVTIVQEAAKVTSRGFEQTKELSYKTGDELVTQYDLESEQLIREQLNHYFPGDGILGEEKGKSESNQTNRLWIIDPIDGTVNFSRGIQMYGISVTLAIENQSILGVVYNPITNELFTAERGKESLLNGQPIKVSNRSELSKSVLYSTELYKTKDIISPLVDKVKQLRITSSSAYETCLVACGRTEGFIKVTSHPWGFAAANLIVEMAGGTVTNFDGSPWNINSTHILSSNGILHSEILDLLVKN